MDENLHKAKELLRKYREDTCTPKEKAWVESWYARFNDAPTDLTDSELADDLASLKAKLDGIPRRRTYKWTTFGTAAAILVAFLSIAISLYWYSREHNQPNELASRQPNDIPPGGNRAMLTFSDGSSINLDENKSGIIVGDSLTYDDGTTIPVEKETRYATIATPNGGQYQVTLPDGSKVWLNAASSLRYPADFSGNERKVVLTGEGYFEVTEDKQRPFIVESNGQSLQVLGTSFNVNAYTDEATVTTTLVSGSVKLYRTPDGPSQQLQPGEQATMRANDFGIKQVDVDDYVFWKTGLIVLNDADLPAIIRQVERWYDVEFIMPEVSTSVKVFGELRRDVRLSEILDALKEYYGLTFEMQGRRVIARE